MTPIHGWPHSLIQSHGVISFHFFLMGSIKFSSLQHGDVRHTTPATSPLYNLNELLEVLPLDDDHDAQLTRMFVNYVVTAQGML